MKYGSIFTEDRVKKQLYDLNKDYRGRQTWANMFANAGLSAQQQQSALNYNYSNALSQAYLSSLHNNSVVAGSNVLNKQALIDQNTLALEEAFNTYSKQHAEGSKEIAKNLSATTTAIDTELAKQASNTVAYANANYEYLQKLYEQYNNGENTLFNDINWSKYLYNETDEEGNIIDSRLKTWTELTAPTYEEDGQGNKQWTSLYDDKGNLTIRGADFFDQMQNELANTGKGMSFGEYLSEANPELLNWATQANPYDFTLAGTNKGSFQTLFGLTSTDEEYTFAERFGGFTQGELKQTFSKFTNFANEYSKIAQSTKGGANNDRKAKLAVDMSNELKSLTDNLGITDDLENELGVSIEDLVANITNNADNMSTGWDITGDFFGTFGTWVGTGASTGAGVGFAAGGPTGIGNAIIGLIGTIVGTAVGAVGGSIHGGINVSNTMKANEAREAEIERAYLDMVDALVMYSNNKQFKIQNELNRTTLY